MDKNLERKSISLKDITKEFPELFQTSQKDHEALETYKIHEICSLDQPNKNGILFVADFKNIQFNIKDFPAVAVLPLNSDAQSISFFKQNKTFVLLSPNPKLALALVSSHFFSTSRIDGYFDLPDESKINSIHSSALIHKTARIEKDVFIGPFTTVGKNCHIKSGTKIASHVSIEDDVQIGKSCIIFSHSVIGKSSELSDFCLIQSHSNIGSDGFGYATDSLGQHFGIPHTGKVKLGKHVHVGSGTQIDRGTFGETSIGDFTKIDNLVHIAHNCKIGKSCFLTAGFMIAGSSEVGDFFVTGGRTSVTGHIKVTSHVQIAGHSAVTSNLTEPGKYGGDPIVPLQDHLKIKSTTTKLVEMRKQIYKILKHLNLDK